MIPLGSTIYRCPFCGAEKRLLRLASGNTIGARYWSDSKMEAPMLPKISFLQRCEECGKYYSIYNLEPEYTKDDTNLDTGDLDYENAKAAYLQIKESGFANDEEEFLVRLYLVFAYNDAFVRFGKKEAPANDVDLFKTNIKRLLELPNRYDAESYILIKAEFLREAGQFDDCISFISESETPQDDYLKTILTKIKEQALKKDSEVFEITG